MNRRVFFRVLSGAVAAAVALPVRSVLTDPRCLVADHFAVEAHPSGYVVGALRARCGCAECAVPMTTQEVAAFTHRRGYGIDDEVEG